MKKLIRLLVNANLLICLTYAAAVIATAPTKAASLACDCGYWESQEGLETLSFHCYFDYGPDFANAQSVYCDPDGDSLIWFCAGQGGGLYDFGPC